MVAIWLFLCQRNWNDFISIGESGCAAFTGCTDPAADNYSEVYVISDNIGYSVITTTLYGYDSM